MIGYCDENKRMNKCKIMGKEKGKKKGDFFESKIMMFFCYSSNFFLSFFIFIQKNYKKFLRVLCYL